MERQESMGHSSRIFIESDGLSSEKCELDKMERAWRKRLSRNCWAVYITIYCMSLEVPFGRYVFSRQLSLLVARIRFIVIVWLSVRLVLFLALGDCQFAMLRAYLYDWTIYYPIDRRANVQRIFISGIVYHICLKISVFHHKRKSFDSSLIDYLCSMPPPRSRGEQASQPVELENSTTLDGTQFRNFPVSGAKARGAGSRQPGRRRAGPGKDCNFLRDRSHWFELSDRVWRAFKTNAIVVLAISSLILIQANWRYILYLGGTRKCDIEMPLMHQIGMLELNFILVESFETLVGSFSYCSMVKSDLMIQAQHVENYLASLMSDIKLNTNLMDPVKPSQSATESNEGGNPAKQGHYNLSRSMASISLPDDKKLLFGGLQSRKMHELISESSDLSRKTFNAVHKITPLPLELANQGIECPRLYVGSRKASVSNSTHFLLGRKVSEFDVADSMLLDSIKEAPGTQPCDKLDTCRRLTNGIVGAQNRVISFLRSIDSHKEAMSFVGNSFLLWMGAGISFVPLLIVSARATTKEQVSDFSYVLSSIISLTMGLMFTYIGATVHKRALGLTGLLFRICSLYHSQAVAVRWNKIFMIWYCPSRCAFKVCGIFELTHLNMLKAISFLISGLTLVLNYLT